MLRLATAVIATLGLGAGILVAARATPGGTPAKGVVRDAADSAQVVQSRAPRNAAEFDTMFQQIKNWGRWGANDQLGSANLVTDATRTKGAGISSAPARMRSPDSG